MPWVKLDDQFPNHPKVLAAGGDAAWLYVAGLCYCQSLLTDGYIPAGMVPRLTDRKVPMVLAEKLVTVRLWEKAEGGYRIHDYHDLNDTSDKVKAKRKATKERVERWREKRGSNGVTEPISNGVTSAIGNGVSNAAPHPHPHPHPIPAEGGNADSMGEGYDRRALNADWERIVGLPAGDAAQLDELLALLGRFAAQRRQTTADLAAHVLPSVRPVIAAWSPGGGGRKWTPSAGLVADVRHGGKAFGEVLAHADARDKPASLPSQPDPDANPYADELARNREARKHRAAPPPPEALREMATDPDSWRYDEASRTWSRRGVA
mgnify:CR=1 FL=1